MPSLKPKNKAQKAFVKKQAAALKKLRSRERKVRPGRARSAGKRSSADHSDLLAKIGSGLGGVISPGIGSVVGELVGKGAGRLFSKIFGRGDYTVQSNSLATGPPPVFGQQSVRIRNREYLSEVFGSSLYANNTYALNPGDSKTFPWLSRIAPLFQQYEIHGVVFEFVSTSSNALNSTNTALGKVILATNYNAVEAPFVDSRSALITQFSNYGKPADNLMHPVECKRSLTPIELLYVRNGPAAADTDLRLYDLGNFQIMTEGMQAVADIGALWISYDVTLLKPVLATSGGTIPTQQYGLGSVGTGLFASVTDEGPPQATVPIVLEPLSVTQSAIVFNTSDLGSVFDILISGQSPASTSIPKIDATYLNCVDTIATTLMHQGGVTAYTAPSTTGPQGWLFHLQVQLTGGTLASFPTVLLTQNAAFPGATFGQFYITQVNSNLPSMQMQQATLPEGFIAYKDSYKRVPKHVVHPPTLLVERKFEAKQEDGFDPDSEDLPPSRVPLLRAMAVPGSEIVTKRSLSVSRAMAPVKGLSREG